MDAVLRVSIAYPDAFERAFPISALDGNVFVDLELSSVEWYNSHLHFLHLFIGFKPPALCLGTMGDIPTMDTQFTRAYVFAYIAYRKICSALSRPACLDYNESLYFETKK